MSRQLPQPNDAVERGARNYLNRLVRDLELRFSETPQVAGGGLTQEEIEDLVGANLVGGDGVSVVYNDGTGQVTISAETDVPYDTLVDESGSFTYVGKAAPGSLESAAVWRIFRVDETSAPDVELRYADGVSTFTKIWNDRTTYTY